MRHWTRCNGGQLDANDDDLEIMIKMMNQMQQDKVKIMNWMLLMFDDIKIIPDVDKIICFTQMII